MPFDMIVTLTAGFLFVALLAGWATSSALSAVAPERRRFVSWVSPQRMSCRLARSRWSTLSIRG